MKTISWNALDHKVSPDRRADLKQEALAEYDRTGFAALRKAREQTQVELASKLGINQASVSAIENGSDLLLSTLTKYVRALGGDIEIRAVFPEATFNLASLTAIESAGSKASTPRRGVVSLKVNPPRRTKAVVRAR